MLTCIQYLLLTVGTQYVTNKVMCCEITSQPFSHSLGGKATLGLCYQQNNTSSELELLGIVDDFKTCSDLGGDRWEQKVQDSNGEWKLAIECELLRLPPFEAGDPERVICLGGEIIDDIMHSLGVAVDATAGTAGITRAEGAARHLSRGCQDRGGKWESVGGRLICVPGNNKEIIGETRMPSMILQP